MRSKRRLGGFSCRAERLPAHTHAHPNSAQKKNQPRKNRPTRSIFLGGVGNLAAAAIALWCTRLPASQLILGSEWTCYNHDFDINELLPFCASFEQ